MTTSEVREHRAALECALSDLIADHVREFNSETGENVLAMDFDFDYPQSVSEDGSVVRDGLAVTCEIYLPLL